MHGLTNRQREILTFIEQSIANRGYPPALREIGRHFEINSTNGISDHLKALEKKGFIVREATARGIRQLRRADGSPPVSVFGHAPAPVSSAEPTSVCPHCGRTLAGACIVDGVAP